MSSSAVSPSFTSRPTTPLKRETVISVAHLSKDYRIWESPAYRLTVPLWQALGRVPVPPLSRRFNARAQRGYRDFSALRDVSFEVHRGECLGIIGRNGSGKSTLLQLLAGTLHPTSGRVETRGRIAALLELGSGFNPEFTGRENVFLNASIYGLTTAEIEQRFDSIVKFADIGEFLEEPVKTYSSGMALRLAFAVVAHVDADVLIIDEALSVGDVFFVQKCMRFIKKFRENGTLLFVTHSAAQLTALCDQAIWLKDGRLQACGSAQEISEQYLEHFHAETTGAEIIHAERKARPAARPAQSGPVHDQRLQFLNTTQFRNDIRLFDFDPDRPRYGTGGARILAVSFQDDQGRRLQGVVGGELVSLVILVEAKEPLVGPVIGFYLKNRLGQYVFGDNTYLSTLEHPLRVPAGGRIQGTFCFQMPVLPPGPYVVAPAVAVGTQEAHVQLDWIHDALVIESTNNQPQRGMVGIPMLEVSLEMVPNSLPGVSNNI